jgi:hypothetical protein
MDRTQCLSDSFAGEWALCYALPAFYFREASLANSESNGSAFSREAPRPVSRGRTAGDTSLDFTPWFELVAIKPEFSLALLGSDYGKARSVE